MQAKDPIDDHVDKRLANFPAGQNGTVDGTDPDVGRSVLFYRHSIPARMNCKVASSMSVGVSGRKDLPIFVGHAERPLKQSSLPPIM
jgi:hypothetical protein